MKGIFIMGKIKDLTGQKFGRLLVIKDSGERKNRQVVWECQCDCGKTTYVVGQALRNGHTQSCGCLQAQRASQTNKKDLTGQKFGKLLVIKQAGVNKHRKAVWECQCQCGNICYRTGTELLVKKFKSCGCLNSKGQLKIKQLLTKNSINFIAQYQNEKLKSPKNMPLKIDFMIIDDENNPIRAIECDGIQHYEPIEHFGGEQAFLYLRKCDTIKNEWCKQNNIPMIRIPNLNIEDIENITLEEILSDKYAI